ncbi:MAG: serine/threonine protein kinase [Myxococcales bacterium]|nr:serine/threonine protein kinase [Myxococcales bacterium]
MSLIRATPQATQHGRYTVVRKLAEGGMAEIFLAKQHGSQGFEKPVVLKRIHAALYADEQFRNMLIDEAHISMGLSHNNIVQVLDLGQAGGRYFLVLELVDGWDLGRLLRRAERVGLPFPPELALYVTAQVCRALGYAHAKSSVEGKPLGIVHRDVSPQNVLISEQGEVKLADFGIAKARRKRDNTETGVVKGKIAFMSPEQALGQTLDARSDLYSLGTLLYLLVLGQRPFEGASDLEVLLRVQQGEFTPPLARAPDLHPALVAILERAMCFDRDQRFGSADDMLADVEGALRNTFASPGQTELKQWLLELARRDGEPPIGRQGPGAVPESAIPGGEITGEALVLGEEAARHDEPTLLHEAGSRRENVARLVGAEPTVADLRIGPSWLEEEAPRAIRSTQPSRWTGLLVVVVLCALGAAGFGLWRAAWGTRAAEVTPLPPPPAEDEATPPPPVQPPPRPPASARAERAEPQLRAPPPKTESVDEVPADEAFEGAADVTELPSNTAALPSEDPSRSLPPSRSSRRELPPPPVEGLDELSLPERTREPVAPAPEPVVAEPPPLPDNEPPPHEGAAENAPRGAAEGPAPEGALEPEALGTP